MIFGGKNAAPLMHHNRLTIDSRPDRVIVHRLRRLTQMFLHSWFESLAVAQFTRRGGHPLQRDSTCGF